jgi:hypothetical protein
MSDTITAGDNTISYSGVIQTESVQSSGLYDITAFGAEGGSGNGKSGGDGAEIGGDIRLMAGEVLKIAVGGEGGNAGTSEAGAEYGGGGGGTFVVLDNSGSYTPLVIAGGGGGAYSSDGGPGLATLGGGGGGGSGTNKTGGGGGGFKGTAGALADNLPARDLLVSADHGILVEDILIQAGALVNGVSVLRQTRLPEHFTDYQIELADHALVLAEGTPAETFVDHVSRLGFDNWDEHEALYPQAAPIAEMAYPRVQSQRQVPLHIRRSMRDRAWALTASSLAEAQPAA